MWGNCPHYITGATWYGLGAYGASTELWRIQLFPCSDDGLDLDEDPAFWVNLSEIDPNIVDPSTSVSGIES